MSILGDIIIFAGVIFIMLGIIGIYRFKDFYSRLLVASKIDTVGAITIIIGFAVKHGIGFFSLKLLLLMGIMLILNPMATHMVARSAHLSGYKGRDGGL